MDVLDGRRPDGVLEPLGIGLADRQAAAEAAAGDGQAEAARPVVAAAQRVDLRRPAELAAAEDDGAIEQARAATGRAAARRTPGRAPSPRARWISWLLTWASQPPSVTSTQRTPTSISRRAARQPRPNGVSPYSARTAAGSCETSNARSCSEVIIVRARASVSRCSVESTAAPAAAGEGPLDDLEVARPAPARAAAGTGEVDVGQLAAGVADLERVELAAQEAAAARPLVRAGSRCAGGCRSGRPAARGSRSRRSRGARPSDRAGSRSSSGRCRARGPPPCSPSSGSGRPGPSGRPVARSPRRAGCPAPRSRWPGCRRRSACRGAGRRSRAGWGRRRARAG